MVSQEMFNKWFVEELIPTEGGGFWTVRHVADSEQEANRLAARLEERGKTIRVTHGS